MADIKKFLDHSGVSTLWTRVAEEVGKEAARAKAAEEAALKAAQDAQGEIDALEEYVGLIPETYTESNIVAYIQKVAAETLTAASGNSSETAASVKDQLDKYKLANDTAVGEIGADVATIIGDYLKKADKDELAADIEANASEIARVDAALKAAIDDEDGTGLDSIKELAVWIEEHGEDAAGYAAAISALEALVGDTAVATQIANAIAAENLAQYAKTAEIEGTLQKVDTQGTVTDAINAAIDALKIGDYAKAADLTALAARVTAIEAAYQTSAQVTASIEAAIAALKAENLWDAKGAAAAAEAAAKAYADGLAGNYDAKGAAAAAEAAAKTYSDANLATAKSYSDANLATAKSYTDEAYNAIQSLTTAEIEAAIAAATTA